MCNTFIQEAPRIRRVKLFFIGITLLTLLTLPYLTLRYALACNAGAAFPKVTAPKFHVLFQDSRCLLVFQVMQDVQK